MVSQFHEKTISIQGIILFCIFLATLNTINAYYYFVFIAFGLLVFGTGCRVNANASFWGLVLLGISYAMFSPYYSNSILGMLKPFSYLFCYMIGYGLNRYEKFDSNSSLKNFYVVCIFVATGSFFHYLLNWFINISYMSRNTMDFWTKTVINATGQAPLACLALAFALACLFSDTSKKVKWISVVVIFLALGYNLILSGRTLFVLSLIILVVAFIHKLREQTGEKGKTILIALLSVTVILMIYNFNLFSVRTQIESTPFYERFFMEDSNAEFHEDSRIEHKIEYITNASSYLFGGTHMREQFGYAHDIFLDTYDEAGIFAFFAIAIYILATLRRMVKCVSNKNLPFEFRQIILCIYIILYVQFMLEPIIQGMPWLLASFCVIDGSVSRILSDYNKNFVEETCY